MKRSGMLGTRASEELPLAGRPDYSRKEGWRIPGKIDAGMSSKGILSRFFALRFAPVRGHVNLSRAAECPGAAGILKDRKPR